MAIVTRKFVKEALGISGTTYDSRIDLYIPHVEADFESIRGIPFDEDSNDEVYYPDNAELIATQMIAYLIQTMSITSDVFNNKVSESIGSYSYTKKGGVEMLKGYPKSIVGRIERYQSTG